jgi:hypothetical protein
VDLHIKARCAGRALHHGLEAAFCEWRTALAHKYEGRFGSLLALEPSLGA